MTTFDFNDPKSAREYLKNIRLGDKVITYIQTNTRRIEFDNCSDEEACEAAQMIYDQLHCYQERLDQGLQS